MKAAIMDLLFITACTAAYFFAFQKFIIAIL